MIASVSVMEMQLMTILPPKHVVMPINMIVLTFVVEMQLMTILLPRRVVIRIKLIASVSVVEMQPMINTTFVVMPIKRTVLGYAVELQQMRVEFAVHTFVIMAALAKQMEVDAFANPAGLNQIVQTQNVRLCFV